MQDLLKPYSDLGCKFNSNMHWRCSQMQYSNNVNHKMADISEFHGKSKQLGLEIQDQDSSSTQSTCQSYPEVVSAGESTKYGKNTMPVQSGCCGKYRKPEGDQTESALSFQDYALSQVDHGQSFAFPTTYSNPYSRGLLAAYVPNSLVPSILGTIPSRVPLPLELPQHEPIYVNAKQYRAILRRREYRAKREAQNKLSKIRKPYLHESRHRHALNRARGPGGRFLNMKKIDDPMPTTAIDSQGMSGASQLPSTSDILKFEVHHLENYGGADSIRTCSDVTNASNSDNISHQQKFSHSFHASQTSGPDQHVGSGTPVGIQQCLSFLW